MKKLITIITIAITSSIHAAIVPLTPGGFSEDNPPAAFTAFLQAQANGNLLFFDEMSAIPYTINGITYPPGWVSQFGVLNGGVYFFCHIDQSGPVPTTTISWDMRGSGYYMTEIYVHGFDPPAPQLSSLYGVTWHGMSVDQGSVTINRTLLITSISFFGTDFLRHGPPFPRLPRYSVSETRLHH
jgi:hypothetical protein